MAKSKRQKKMSAAAISHYYSSTSKEHTPSPGQADKQARQDAEEEVAITKEIHHTAARTLKQMAQSAKRRPRLSNTS